METIKNKPFIVVDLGSGGYVANKKGHECFNTEANAIDGRYYGYCPPWDNINIRNLGASVKDQYVDGVVVIYTTRCHDSSDREVVAFTDSARVYSEPQKDEILDRTIFDEGKKVHCTYSIESDNLFDLSKCSNKFVIQIRKYNVYMFRRQRFYKGTYPDLDKELIDYLDTFLNGGPLDDDFDFQEEIQNTTITYKTGNQSDASQEKPTYSNSSKGKVVNKSQRVSKLSLMNAQFECAYDNTHLTFLTAKGYPYMEGHHLIPCTASNADRYWRLKKRNIDCVENVICLCPTCHRKIHFGSKPEQEQIIRSLYYKQEQSLKKVKLDIGLEELLMLYKIK